MKAESPVASSHREINRGQNGKAGDCCEWRGF